MIIHKDSKKHSKVNLFDTYLVLMVGISKLLLLLCTGKESLERALARLLSELLLKVEVALNTSAMKFHPRLTTFSSCLDFSDPLPWESEWDVGWRLGLLSGWQLTLGPYRVVVGGLVGGITNSISFWLLKKYRKSDVFKLKCIQRGGLDYSSLIVYLAFFA